MNIGHMAMQLTATAGQFMATMDSAARSYQNMTATVASTPAVVAPVQLGAYTNTLNTAQAHAVNVHASVANTLGKPVNVAPPQFGTFMASLNRAQTEARLTANWKGWEKGSPESASRTSKSGGESSSTLIALGGKLTSTFLAWEGIKWGISVANQAKRAEVAFEQLLGSATKARALNQQITQFSTATGIDPAITRKGVQQLLVAQFTARDAMRVTQAAMAAAATSPMGMQQGTEQITRALAQIKAKGKASAEEITQQLGEAGINGWDMIAKKLGKKVPEVMKLAEQGMIDSATAINAITEGMEAKYSGSIQKRAVTMEGAWEKMKAVAATSLAGVFDERFQSGAARALGWVSTLIEVVSKVFGVIEGLVTKVVDGISSAFEWLSNTMLGKGLAKLWDMTGGAVGRWLGVGQAADTAGNSIEQVGAKTKQAMDLAAQAIGPAQQAFNDWTKKTKEAIQDFGLDEHAKEIAKMKRLGLDSGRVNQAQGMANELRMLEERKKLMEEGKTLAEGLLNPSEKYYQETGKYYQMLQAGAIDQVTYNRAVEQSGENYRKSNDALLNQNKAYTAYNDAVKQLTADIEKLKFTEEQLLMNRLKAAGVADAELQKIKALQDQKKALEDQKRLYEQISKELSKTGKFGGVLGAVFGADAKAGKSGRSAEAMFAGAATRGSREAYTAIISARQSVNDPKDLQKQTNAKLDGTNQRLDQVVAAINAKGNNFKIYRVEKL